VSVSARSGREPQRNARAARAGGDGQIRANPLRARAHVGKTAPAGLGVDCKAFAIIGERDLNRVAIAFQDNSDALRLTVL
jgi:hypothetical protein